MASSKVAAVGGATLRIGKWRIAGATMVAAVAALVTAGVAEAAISLSPGSQSHQTGTTAGVTAHLTRGTSTGPLPGFTVTFTVTSGPNAGVAGTAVTDAGGNASFSYA